MIEGTRIRLCNAGDETVLALLGQATFLESFAGMADGQDILSHCAHQHSPTVYRKWLNDGKTRIWTAEIPPGNAPVGYLVMTSPDLPISDPQANDLEIKRIYLLHPFQGSGIGRRLMAEAIAFARTRNCRRLLLGVHSRNIGAIAFYERLGFTNVGTRKFKVGSHIYDDLVFALTL